MKNIPDQLYINMIRTLAMDAVQQANSGHPGAAMAMAPVTYTLFEHFMKFNPANPVWINRDRFILSAGHASMLLYATLYINGYDITLDDIRAFRQLHGRCPGHPEYGETPGVETTTGPLGQGIATSVGFAIAEKWLASYFNRPGFDLIRYDTFSLAGDGCMMEGISCEAASLAGHLGLDNLVWIYDNNHITIEGKTDLTFSEDIGKRFDAFGWNVHHVTDANDLSQLHNAFKAAKVKNGKPTLIIVDSHIAFGAPNKQDSHSAHGAPLGEEEVKATKRFYGWDPDKKFFVPEEIAARSKTIIQRGEQQNAEWDELFRKYSERYPQLANELNLILENKLPEDWDQDIPAFDAGTKISGRAASSKVLNAISGMIPFMIGGSADLGPSTLTELKNSGSFMKNNYSGRNLHYGIREHAMGAIANGIALSGLRTFASTFFVFSDYCKPSIRLSALMKLPVIYVFTHDSIGVGEDGPTHQPVEHLAALRAMPGIDVIRPADANEVAVLWRYIMNRNDKPVALVLSRQDLPVIDRNKYGSAECALKGGYIVAGEDNSPDVLLLATGSEVHIAIEAYEILKSQGIGSRVVSMPCWSLFEQQSHDYIEEVLPSSVLTRIAIEAGVDMGWHKFIGLRGKIIGMPVFGASGKPNDLMKEFGITVESVVEVVKKELSVND